MRSFVSDLRFARPESARDHRNTGADPIPDVCAHAGPVVLTDADAVGSSDERTEFVSSERPFDAPDVVLRPRDGVLRVYV